MRLKHYLLRSLTLPPHVVFKKAIIKAQRELSFFYRHQSDKKLSTYEKNYSVSSPKLYSYLHPISLEVLRPFSKQISAVSKLFVNHYFDLLGSGWVQVKYGMQCRGLEGHRYDMSLSQLYDKEGHWLKGKINSANLSESQRIWKMVDSDYSPIDWNIDFKSGYRWASDIWYQNVPYAHKPGVDIKVPWELARMQHLTQLAWAFALAKEVNSEFYPPNFYVREFRNQILDFIATNPPRYGVNWRCTMDVAIRIVNWLVSFDILCAFGASFDKEFIEIFHRSVYEHGKYCIENLEYSPELRSNHYLSDIAGVLFSAAYLPRSSETDRWLAFAVQELISEVEHEFHADGSNFEASTSYHRLSTEIMYYCVSLCITLPKDKREALKHYDSKGHRVLPVLRGFYDQKYNLTNPEILPKWCWGRLEKAAEFTMHLKKPNGLIPQFGDNDSGRFLKIWPKYVKRTVSESIELYENLKGYVDLSPEEDFWEEEILDHSHLTGVAGAIFRRPDLLKTCDKGNPEVILLQKWLKGMEVPTYHNDRNKPLPAACSSLIQNEFNCLEWIENLKKEFGQPFVTEFQSEQDGQSLLESLESLSYPDFGLYVYRSSRLFLAIRCGNIGQNGNGGHAHNDQLSIELIIDDKDIICDPGTYIYTPIPDKRNLYRSTAAHFTPQGNGKEQNDWLAGTLGLFNMKDQSKGECLYFEDDGFVGRHIGFGKPIYRIILLIDGKVEIIDFGINPPIQNTILYSNGYGKCIRKEKKY